MSEPEVKFEIDEHGCIGFRVTNEGVLLSKDEKERIIDHVMRMQAENAKLREFARESFSMAFNFYHGAGTAEDLRQLKNEYRELGIEEDNNA